MPTDKIVSFGPLSFGPGALYNMRLVEHTGAIKFPRDDVHLKVAHIDAVKAGSHELITLFVELPGQRDQAPDPAPGETVTKMLENVAFLVHPYTFQVWAASGTNWAQPVGDIDELFPKAARELEMAVCVRDENIANSGVHFYPENKNCPGPRNQEYMLLNLADRFVRAKLGQPDSGTMVLFFVNNGTREVVPEFYRPKKPEIDWNNPADISDINKWRGQVLSRKKCELVRFDKAVDDMWTVKEQGHLNKMVRHTIEYHKREGRDEDLIFDCLDWDIIKQELEQECKEPQGGHEELAICCDADLPGEGFAQRRHLLSERVTFCRNKELIKQRAIVTISTIMETPIDEGLLKEYSQSFINLVDLDSDSEDEDEAEALVSRKGKEVARPRKEIVTNKVVSGRIIKAQASNKKGGVKRGAKSKPLTGAAKTKKDKKDAAIAEAMAAQSSGSSFVVKISQSSQGSVTAGPSSDEDSAAPAARNKGKGKATEKEIAAWSDEVVMADDAAAENNREDSMEVDNEQVAAAIALSKFSNVADDGAGPAPRTPTPKAKPTRGGARHFRGQK